MNFKEYLTSKGVTEEQATQIVSGMPDEKFHLTSEEKLDDRYGKLKTQKEQLEEDLQNANQLVEDLKKSNKTNEDLQSQIDDYKNQLETVNAQRLDDQKNSAIELALTQSGALDNKAAKALLDLDKLELSDDGLKGLDEQINSLKESKGFLFQKEQDPTFPHLVKGGNPKGSNNSSKSISEMSYQEVADLKANNPDAFADLTK